jgi:acetoin utilization protein AcuB
MYVATELQWRNAMNTQPVVTEWMQTEVITINPELHVERAWEIMERQRVNHLPVVKNGQLMGIVTQGDLKRALFRTPLSAPAPPEGRPQPTKPLGDMSVAAIMTKTVHTATPTEPLLSVAQRLLNAHIGSLPVVDETDAVVGIVTKTNLVQALVRLLQQ